MEKEIQKLIQDREELEFCLDRISTTLVKHDKKLITTNQMKKEVGLMLIKYYELP